jgi:hypothetical protein
MENLTNFKFFYKVIVHRVTKIYKSELHHNSSQTHFEFHSQTTKHIYTPQATQKYYQKEKLNTHPLVTDPRAHKKQSRQKLVLHSQNATETTSNHFDS